MTSLSPRIDKLAKVVHGNKIESSLVTVPYTTIKNEHGQDRQIPDLENNLKVSMGVERIAFNSISKLDNEFGPNGEEIFELDNKDKRVRFIGSTSMDVTTSGMGISVSAGTDLNVEITFYGTGLNILNNYASSITEMYTTVDGGSEGSNIIPVTISTVLTGRSTAANHVMNVSDGLSLGWHTVKLRLVSLAGEWRGGISGCEILNESTQLTINAGKSLAHSYELLSLANLPYKPTLMTGTVGGRVIVYQDIDGEVKQAYTEVGSPAYLSSADHENEEIVRRINFKEFGANRSDDFSTLGSSESDRAFTLDDGTTTLVGYQVIAYSMTGADVLCTHGVVGRFITLTFVGTGLSIDSHNTNVSATIGSLFVDGADQGTLTTPAYYIGIQHICSGLPYGTHTVKISTDGAGYGCAIKDFIIHQPIKPSIPEGAIELADYNVMADFVANTTVDENIIGTGLLRKMNAREFTYTGTWTIAGVYHYYPSGFGAYTDTDGDYVEYSFYGTGIALRFQVIATSSTVSINGSSDLSSYTTSYYGDGGSFTDSTGVILGNSGADAGLNISGLTLGHHTIRFTATDVPSLWIYAFDIITPIHINNFKSGSQSLLDLRDEELVEDLGGKVDWTRAKAYIKYDQTTNEILESKNVSHMLDLTSGLMRICFAKPFKDLNYVVALAASYPARHIHTPPTSDAVQYRPNKSSFVIALANTSHAEIDGVGQAVVFGELENEESINLENYRRI